MNFELISNSPSDTIQIGRKLGALLGGGEILGLIGPLGSGKTHLIKGIASGLGADITDTIVNSPTFVIVNEYPTQSVYIYHIDAYRLNSVDEFEMIGFDDYCRPDSVVLIEWADKIESALKGVNWIRIELNPIGQDDRTIRITNAPDNLVIS